MKQTFSERWQTSLALGLVMSAGSIFVFWDLTEWEADPASGSRSMNCVAVLIYKIGGKWLLSGLILAVGCFLTASGLRRRRTHPGRSPRPNDPGERPVD